MPDPIHGVSGTDALGIAPAGQSEAGPVPVNADRPGPQPQVDSADVARAQALLATITAAANMVPPANLTRVAELRQAIASGTYQANPQQIAKMIMEIEGLLAKGKAG